MLDKLRKEIAGQSQAQQSVITAVALVEAVAKLSRPLEQIQSSVKALETTVQFYSRENHILNAKMLQTLERLVNVTEEEVHAW